MDVLEQQQQGSPLVKVAPAAAAGEAAAQQNPQVWTKFVAETLLPTKLGKFRLRGYRHTVDGGRTFTEPTVIIAGSPEGCTDVPVRVHDACYTSEVGAGLVGAGLCCLQRCNWLIEFCGCWCLLVIRQEVFRTRVYGRRSPLPQRCGCCRLGGHHVA